MKTLFVVSEKSVNKHVGEDYDDIIEVEHQPTTETIQEWANCVKDRIRALWHAQVGGVEGDPDKTLVTPDKMAVAVYLDAASPFNAMLLNLRIIMKAEEGIVIELPYLSEEMRRRLELDEINDPEADALLRRLGRK